MLEVLKAGVAEELVKMAEHVTGVEHIVREHITREDAVVAALVAIK
jgi:hypothetical protein